MAAIALMSNIDGSGLKDHRLKPSCVVGDVIRSGNGVKLVQLTLSVLTRKNAFSRASKSNTPMWELNITYTSDWKEQSIALVVSLVSKELSPKNRKNGSVTQQAKPFSGLFELK